MKVKVALNNIIRAWISRHEMNKKLIKLLINSIEPWNYR